MLYVSFLLIHLYVTSDYLIPYLIFPSSGITYCEVEDGDQFFYHELQGYYFSGDSNITESTSSFASIETDNSVVIAADTEDALFWDELGPLQPSATTLRPQLPINCPVLPPTKKKKAKLAAASATKKSDFLMTKEELAKYFHMPITKAARELKVGLTALKKRCRELGVKRWPHRKLKSLQKLIDNVSRMAEAVESEEGVGMRLEKAIRLLENERKMLDESPDLELGTSTKRLRQACFKANYKEKQMNGSIICS
ncbi:Protein RKD1 [Linum perenne]